MFTLMLLYTRFVGYFSTNFYFSPNDSPSKTMKDVFYFIEKPLFILEFQEFWILDNKMRPCL